MKVDTELLDLIKIKVDILKLKADSYNWQCHVPENVKTELDEVLNDVNTTIKFKKAQNKKRRAVSLKTSQVPQKIFSWTEDSEVSDATEPEIKVYLAKILNYEEETLGYARCTGNLLSQLRVPIDMKEEIQNGGVYIVDLYNKDNTNNIQRRFKAKFTQYGPGSYSLEEIL